MARPVVLILVDIAAWTAIHTATGYAVHRMPSSSFARDSALYRQRALERDGLLYERVLRIRRWKRRLPEAGAVFRGGFDKRHLHGRGVDDLVVHTRETRRAELGHWLATITAPLFFLWNPWPVGVVMLAYAAAVNGPCIAAQRYNRIRLVRIVHKRAILAAGLASADVQGVSSTANMGTIS